MRVAHSLGNAPPEGQEWFKLRAVEVEDVVPRPRSEARVFVRLHSQSGTDLPVSGLCAVCPCWPFHSGTGRCTARDRRSGGHWPRHFVAVHFLGSQLCWSPSIPGTPDLSVPVSRSVVCRSLPSSRQRSRPHPDPPQHYHMLTRIEALNFRCLRYVSRPLDRFHVLVGPNASGKTTFLDVVGFVSRLVSGDLTSAIESRSPSFESLLFRKEGSNFELALEAALPESIQREITGNAFDVIRYQVSVRFDQSKNQVLIDREKLWVEKRSEPQIRQLDLFPNCPTSPVTMIRPRRKNSRTIITRSDSGRANYYSETYKETGKGWGPPWDLRTTASALTHLPADESKYPVATWFKELISNGIVNIVLDSIKMRSPSAAGQGKRFKTDGSNLPWVVKNLIDTDPDNYKAWIDHVQTALPDLIGVSTQERPEDRSRYLILQYRGGLEVPSWVASDGTLRLLALTLPAYLDDLTGVLMIEEPENGIHPRAVETMFQALSNLDKAQILVATHSPIILNIAEPKQVLCFAKDQNGATDIVRGDEHPALVDWQHDVSLGTLFASGVLG